MKTVSEIQKAVAEIDLILKNAPLVEDRDQIDNYFIRTLCTLKSSLQWVLNDGTAHIGVNLIDDIYENFKLKNPS